MTIFILGYVDDIIVTSSKPHVVIASLKQLGDDFPLIDLADLHYFLGIEVNKVEDGIILSQDKYANDLLKRATMTICKPMSIPLFVTEKLSSQVGTSLGPNDATNYKGIIDTIQ